MSKRITTRWYIGAWVAWFIALIATIAMSRGTPSAATHPAGIPLAYLVMGLAGIVMLVMWIGALVRLAQESAWGWFVGVLILHLVALGIIGMVAYAIAGPEDQAEVVMRPTVT